MVLFPKLYCNVFGHKFEVTKSITRHVKEYKCCNCNKEMTTNSNGNLTELTPKFREINNALEYIYSKRKIKVEKPQRLTA